MASLTTRSVTGKYVLLVVAGLAITLATGLVYGRLTQRWGPTVDLSQAGRQLETFPTRIGDWQMLSDEPMSRRVVEMLSCAGHINRQYVNERTGQTITVAIIVGPPGPTSVHTPEICYSSRDYEIQDERKMMALNGKDGAVHSFWRVAFRSNEAAADELSVYYAWAEDKNWLASRLPRLEFAGRPMLYKLQLAGLVAPGEGGGDADPGKRFLIDWLQLGWNIGHDKSESGT